MAECFKCSVRESAPAETKLGQVTLAMLVSVDSDLGGIIRDPSTTYRYKIVRVAKHYVCDSCARKAHDWGMSIVLGISLPLFLLFTTDPSGAGVLMIFSGLGVLVGLWGTGSYWLQQEDKRSAYCRDRIVQEVYENPKSKLLPKGVDTVWTRFTTEDW